MGSSLAICLLLVATASLADAKSYRGYKVMRVVPTTIQQVDHLMNLKEFFVELDFWMELRLMQYVDINIPPFLVEYMPVSLAKVELQGEIIHEDVQDLIDQNKPKHVESFADEKVRTLMDRGVVHPQLRQFITGESRTPDWLKEKLKEAERSSSKLSDSVVGNFPRYDDLMAWMLSLEQTYPDLATTEDIGATYQGRTMRLIKLGTKGGTEKPIIWVDGGIHAREWITVGVSVWLINLMLSTYSANLNTTVMLDRYDWYFLPVANPDGYEYSHTTDRLWRKNLAPNEGTPCIGTDPNRNFGYLWNGTNAPTDPCTDAYQGSAAFSAPCAQNMRDAILPISNKTRMYINLHSFSQTWLTPYGADTPDPPDSDELVAVANKGAQALYLVAGQRYEVGVASKVLYPSPGASFDWAKGDAGIKYSYVLELGPSRNTLNGFVVPTTDIQSAGLQVWAGLVEVAYLVLPSAP